ncbi:MAG TPA: hypothetical protein VH370_25870 [Humisphaera sp.]|jgi:septal ring factor EnvC (AmiA/AmiB activator)|nr:hypothetical protein [Humisphaera sp.]
MRNFMPFVVRAGAMIAAILSLAVGCKHETPPQQAQQEFHDYQERIREVIKDPDRAQQMIELTDDLQRQVNQLRVQLANSRAELAAMDANYNTTRAEFEAVFRQQDADRQVLIDKAISARAQMSKLLTESEWKSLHDIGLETLDADLKALAS